MTLVFCIFISLGLTFDKTNKVFGGYFLFSTDALRRKEVLSAFRHCSMSCWDAIVT